MPESNNEIVVRLKIIRDLLYTGYNPLVHYNDDRHVQLEQAYNKTQDVIRMVLSEISIIIPNS